LKKVMTSSNLAGLIEISSDKIFIKLWALVVNNKSDVSLLLIIVRF